jgi:hypothetical protein
MCAWFSAIMTERSSRITTARITAASPPGLAKKGKIPPGHAARLRRHQGVPPGVTWDYLPADVERRLDRLPDGYVRVVIGADIAILHTRTRVVLDVIEDIHD